MYKLRYIAVVAVFLFVNVIFGLHTSVYAQSSVVAVNNQTLYNQDGSQAALSTQPGYYYTKPGGQSQDQVYYFGNGNYYNPTTKEYGTVAGQYTVIDNNVFVSGTILYNKDSTIPSTSQPIPAGYYYTKPGGQSQDQVYYFGNGNYYNVATGAYGTLSTGSGSVILAQATGGTTGPSVINAPNTGTGGNALFNWFMFVISGLLTFAGAAFITRQIATRQ